MSMSVSENFINLGTSNGVPVYGHIISDNTLYAPRRTELLQRFRNTLLAQKLTSDVILIESYQQGNNVFTNAFVNVNANGITDCTSFDATTILLNQQKTIAFNFNYDKNAWTGLQNSVENNQKIANLIIGNISS